MASECINLYRSVRFNFSLRNQSGSIPTDRQRSL
ncbi:hypothetical protein AHF37_01227 [Paragonimus kellicotti]|nr:hypothetical protein AHF37_01227 [Paragonimus kellicotti]